MAELYNYEQEELNTDDVMFLDVPESNTVYLWVGEGADADEKRLGPELVKVSSAVSFEQLKLIIFPDLDLLEEAR